MQFQLNSGSTRTCEMRHPQTFGRRIKLSAVVQRRLDRGLLMGNSRFWRFFGQKWVIWGENGIEFSGGGVNCG
eukprot:1101693-Prorocentrum_minimum.AAC.1